MIKYLYNLFNNKPELKVSGRKSVKEYVDEVKKEKGSKCYENELKSILKIEIEKILTSYQNKLKVEGVEVLHKDIVDRIYVLEITPVKWTHNVTFFYYKNILFSIDKDGVLIKITGEE